MNNFVHVVNIFGVNISCVGRQDVLQISFNWANEPDKHTIFYVNAHCLNHAINDSVYREVLNAADLVYTDGISLVWASKFLGGCTLEKITGRDWIHDFCDLAEKQDQRIYILAGKPGIAQTATHNLVKLYPNLKIIGTHPGYLNESNNSSLLAEINQAKPDVLLVGMGTPQQEKWLAAHRDQIHAPVCWAVGALFDYIAGVEPPVPEWLNRLNLEWFWRMLIDPKGKWRRYLIGNPIFIYRILRQKLR